MIANTNVDALEPSTSRKPSGPRPRIVRHERVEWGRLDTKRRVAIRDATYAILSASYTGYDIADFEALFLEPPGTVLGLWYGEDNRLAGFCSVRFTIVTISGQRFGVFSGGPYFDTRYRGGRRAMAFALGETLRVKLRHPGLRLGYLGFTHTPAPYRLNAQTMPRVFPGRAGEPPEEYVEVIRAALRLRGWPSVGDDPWVIATPMRPRTSDWLDRNRSMTSDPDVQFYLRRAPGWADQGHALIVWIPLEMRDIAGGLMRALTRRRRARSS